MNTLVALAHVCVTSVHASIDVARCLFLCAPVDHETVGQQILGRHLSNKQPTATVGCVPRNTGYFTVDAKAVAVYSGLIRCLRGPRNFDLQRVKPH